MLLLFPNFWCKLQALFFILMNVKLNYWRILRQNPKICNILKVYEIALINFLWFEIDTACHNVWSGKSRQCNQKLSSPSVDLLAVCCFHSSVFCKLQASKSHGQIIILNCENTSYKESCVSTCRRFVCHIHLQWRKFDFNR